MLYLLHSVFTTYLHIPSLVPKMDKVRRKNFNVRTYMLQVIIKDLKRYRKNPEKSS